MFTHPLFPAQYEPWQAFISTNPNYTLEWGGSEKQKKWGQYCLTALQRAAVQFGGQAEANSLVDIYNFCARERLKIARVLSHEPEYGRSRLNDFRGSRVSPFSADRLRTKDQFEELKSSFDELESKSEGLKPKFELSYFAPSEVTVSYEGITVGKLAYEQFYKHDDRIAEALTVRYPFPKEARQLLEKADEIWQKIFSEKDILSTTEKYKCLGKILWLLAFACPLRKGSAATSEIVFHLLCHKLGLPLLPIKSDKSWDIYAMFTESPEEFADWFYQNLIYPIPEAEYQEYQLPLMDGAQDNTEEIQKEVDRLQNELLQAYKIQEANHAFQFSEENFEASLPDPEVNRDADLQYPETNFDTGLQDPYGLSLFHYWYLGTGSLDTDELSAEYYYRFPWVYLSNGKHLFFDVLETKALDPFVLLADLGTWRGNTFEDVITEQKCLLRGLQDIFDKSEIKGELDAACLNVLKKILIHATLVYADYDSDLAEKILSLQQQIKAELAIDLNSLASLILAVKSQKLAFSFPHLMYLTRYRDCDLKHYEGLPLTAWVEKRAELNGKSLLDGALEHKNHRLLITFPHKKITYQDMAILVDTAMESDSQEKQRFLFEFLFLSFPEDQMKLFMDIMGEKYANQEAFFNLALFSLCQIKDDLSKENINSFFEVFLAVIKGSKEVINNKDSDGKSPLYYALLNMKTFVVERLISCDVNFDAIITSVDSGMQEGINHVLCFSTEVEVKGEILLKISDDALKSIFDYQIYSYRIDQCYKIGELTNFCEGLSWAVAANNKTPKDGAFFQRDSKGLKKNLINILTNLIKEEKKFAVFSYLTHLNIFELEDYKKLKATLDPLNDIDKCGDLRALLEARISSLERQALQRPGILKS